MRSTVQPRSRMRFTTGRSSAATPPCRCTPSACDGTYATSEPGKSGKSIGSTHSESPPMRSHCGFRDHRRGGARLLPVRERRAHRGGGAGATYTGQLSLDEPRRATAARVRHGDEQSARRPTRVRRLEPLDVGLVALRNARSLRARATCLPSFTAACVWPGLPNRASRGSMILAESIGAPTLGGWRRRRRMPCAASPRSRTSLRVPRRRSSRRAR